MERAIDINLALYFIKDNPPLMHELVEILIDRIPFESKRTALKAIIDKTDEEDFKAGKHGKNKKNHKNLLEDIRKMAHIRNYFAHYHPVYLGNNPQWVIGLVQFRDSAKIIGYTQDEFDDFITDISRCRSELSKLRNG
ncbi:MAG: hypothetical protein ACXVJB_12775 [Mucilaginibacter sp.]